MITAHLKNLTRRFEISSEEERVIHDSVAEIRDVRSDEIVIRAGEQLNVSLLLLEGWLARSKDLEGGDRQIMQLHVAGDFADLHSFTLKRLEHDVSTLSDCRIAVVPHERLRAMTENHPRLTRIYWFLTNVDAAIQWELTLSLGRRTALSRMAHLFCELNLRLEAVGLASDGRYEFPLTQRELSECLGLTVVHANRMLQELRRRELIELGNGRLRILDRASLGTIAEFDPSYLYLDRQSL